MGHIVLFGDSIFDNGGYVPGGPDVVTQVQAVLPAGWSATLRAVDGATTRDVTDQIVRLPSGATHLVVSAGGNDALGQAHLLDAPVKNVAQALILLAATVESFAASYRAMVAQILGLGLPTALCTIYDTPLSAPGQPVVRTAIALFNDVITRSAFAHGLPLIDLRLICSEDSDYANPIEPSVQGGAKIAAAIAALVSEEAGTKSSRIVAARTA